MDEPPGRAADLGCFIPYMSIALARLGWKVAAADRYSLYGEVLRRTIFDLGQREGFDVVDVDIMRDDSMASLGERDLVLLMAVVEHLNGSPRQVLANIWRLLPPEGMLLFEVPNIAELSKRIRLLRGKSPLPLYSSYLASSYPFEGHNREMTVAEVKYLLLEMAFHVQRVDCFDYSPPVSTPKRVLLGALRRLVPASRETIMAVATRLDSQPEA